MNRAQAIKQHCTECSGGTPKEVTLCHIVNCPLWPFRFGYSVKDRRFKKRMEAAKRKYPNEYQEVISLMREYAKNTPNLGEFVQIDAFLTE